MCEDRPNEKDAVWKGNLRPPKVRFSDHVLDLLEHAHGQGMALGEILSFFSFFGHAALVAFLGVMLMAGIPVVSICLCVAVAFVGFSLLLKTMLWLPRSLSAVLIPHARLVWAVQWTSRVLVHTEGWSRPRLTALVTNSFLMRMHGAYIVLVAMLGAVPLPLPFKSLVTAPPLILMGLALVEQDGVLLVSSYLAGIPLLLYYAGIAFAGFTGWAHL